MLAIALSIEQWGERKDLIAGALRLDELTLILTILFCVAGIATVLLSWRHVAPREAAHGEYYALLLTSIAGMIVLVAAQNLVSVFLGLELLSIPLYVLCATEMRRASSLESGPEVPRDRLRRLGDAALRHGVPLRRDGLDGLLRDRRRARRLGRPASPTRCC